MSKGRIAPMRPSIARILKRQIGGFVREYDKAVNAPGEPAKQTEKKEQPAEEKKPKEGDA